MRATKDNRRCGGALIALAVLLFCSTVLFVSGPAEAMQMMDSFPSAKAIVAGHNAQYVVRFDTLVNHQTSRLTITGPDKPAQELRIILHSDPKSLTASAPRLPPGEYELHWRAYSMSGEASEGTVPFTVAP